MLLEYSKPSHLDLFNAGTDVLETSTVIETLYRLGMPLIKLHHTAGSNLERQFLFSIPLVSIDLATQTMQPCRNSQAASKISDSLSHAYTC